MKFNAIDREFWHLIPCRVYDADGMLINKYIRSGDTETGEVVVIDFDLLKSATDRIPTHTERHLAPLRLVPTR